MECGKVLKQCRFCDTGFEQANAASVMTPIKCSVVLSANSTVGIVFGILIFVCTRLEKTFQSCLPLISELFVW